MPEWVRVKLIKKLAQKINDVDLSGADVGDTIPLSENKAALLIAEGWGELVPSSKNNPNNP